MRRVLVLLSTIAAAVAALCAVTMPAYASPAAATTAATPAASPVDSNFSFCNSNIACFKAKLHFAGHKSFTLSSIQLENKLCDNRSAYADVYDQNGYMYEFRNSSCNTTKDFSSVNLNDSGGVHYVYIALYQCNLNIITGCSSNKNSTWHYNPYW